MCNKRKTALFTTLLASSILTIPSYAQVLTEPPHGSVLFPAGVLTYYYNPGFPDTDLLPSRGSLIGRVKHLHRSIIHAI